MVYGLPAGLLFTAPVARDVGYDLFNLSRDRAAAAEAVKSRLI
jgi:hypothetical protein